LGIIDFCGGRKIRELGEKTLKQLREKMMQHATLLTYDAESGNQTQAMAIW
jgi:hypothetical protein